MDVTPVNLADENTTCTKVLLKKKNQNSCCFIKSIFLENVNVYKFLLFSKLTKLIK